MYLLPLLDEDEMLDPEGISGERITGILSIGREVFPGTGDRRSLVSPLTVEVTLWRRFPGGCLMR